MIQAVTRFAPMESHLVAAPWCCDPVNHGRAALSCLAERQWYAGMDDMLAELEKVFTFKESTAPGDIVIVVMENPQAVLYARVAEIERDVTKRDPWWHVTMDILALPPQRVTWTLREPQFTGKEIFTMGGDKRFVKALAFAPAAAPPSVVGSGRKAGGTGPSGQAPTGKGGRGRLRLIK